MKEKVIIILFLLTILCFSGCEEKKTSSDDCPCPEQDSDPTGGSLEPIEPLQHLNISFSGSLDFTDIIKQYGQVEGSDIDRTAMINITIFNMENTTTTASISLRNNGIKRRNDRLFMKSTIWICDGGITYYLYNHRSWREDNWYCSTYDYNDYGFDIPSNENITINLFYMLDSQLSGAFMDGQIYVSPYECFGIHFGENNERWQYFPIEVRT